MAQNIRLKHSSTKDKKPAAGDLQNGELALNINVDSPGAFIKDSDGNVVSLTDGTNVEGYPDLNDGDGTTLDGRYVKTAGDATAQTVTGTGGLKTDGLLESAGGVKISGGTIDLTSADGEIAYGTDPQGVTNSLQIKGANGGMFMRFFEGGVHVSGDNSRSGTAYGGIYSSTAYKATNTKCRTFTDSCDYADVGDVSKISFFASAPKNLTFSVGATETYEAFSTNVNADATSGNNLAYAFCANGSAPSFLKGSTYIGGSTARNTLELYKSTLTTEQLEVFEAARHTAPANVIVPGDGSYVRQWWYDQQDAETQAALTAGTLVYPENLQPANFTDTFALGDNTNINLLSTGEAYFAGDVGIGTDSPQVKLDINGKARSTSTVAGDDPTTLTTKDYVDANSGGGGGTTINYNGAAAWGSVTNAGVINGSMNVATVTKPSTGRYDIVFATPMPNDNYSVTTGGSSNNISLDSVTATGFTVYTVDNSFSVNDYGFNFAVHALNALPPKGGTGTDAWATVDLTTVNGPCNVPASFNVASVTRTNEGVYDVVFTTPMPTDSFAINATGLEENRMVYVTTQSTTGFSVGVETLAGAFNDGKFGFTVNATNAQLPDTVTQEQIDAALNTWTRDGTTLKPANAGDDVDLGNIQLNADGSASFAGGNYTISSAGGVNQFSRINLKVGPEPTQSAFSIANVTGSSVKARWYGDGSLSIGGTINGNSAATDNPNIALNMDGSAEFASWVTGDIGFIAGANPGTAQAGAKITYEGTFTAANNSATTPTYQAYEVGGSSDPTFKVMANGSATFAGEIRHESNSTGYGLVVNKTGDNGPGVYIVCNNSTDANLDLLRVQSGYGAAGTKDRFRVLNDGSAEFAGGLIELKSSGQVYSNRTTANGACFYGNLNGTNTSSILADGSAQFAGSLTCGSNLSNASSAKAVVNNLGTFTSYKGGASTDTAFAAYSIGAAKTTASIFADGSAEFAGQVIANQSFFSQPDAGYSGMYIYGDNTSEPEALVVRPANNQGVSAQINFDGSAEFAGTVTATVVPPSDARFKENITPAKPQLADVVALGGILKNYDWNDDAPLNEEIRSQRQLGLIAQEAEEVCPAIVKEIHRTKTVEVTPAVTGPKGRVITEAVTEELDDSYKGISQDALIMKLIGAVAELSARIETLEAAENA
jgi:hypothetical protein